LEGFLPFGILIADDHVLMRRTLRACLETNSDWHVCAEVANGSDAIEAADDCKPDLVILDLLMPEVNGLCAARAISQAHPNMPVLLYTLHSFDGLDEEARKHGIRAVVHKTAGNDCLVNFVALLLNQSSARPAKSRTRKPPNNTTDS
jgi:DNA-binding NarL/FixJ family response regulator